MMNKNVSMPFKEAKALVERTKWYHGWEILPGLFTGGKSKPDPKRALDLYGVPADLRGVRALDIGAWDGPYSFELERRGAEVLSYDIQDPDSTAYNTAKKILGSSCMYSRGSVYDLDPAKHGHFDLVLFLGVFYHLKHPMVAWNNIREIMNPEAIMFFEGAILDWAYNVDESLKSSRSEIEAVKKLPVTYFAAGNYAGSWSNWYIPTATCLHDWLIAAGFKDIYMGFKEKSSRAYGREFRGTYVKICVSFNDSVSPSGISRIPASSGPKRLWRPNTNTSRICFPPNPTERPKRSPI